MLDKLRRTRVGLLNWQKKEVNDVPKRIKTYQDRIDVLKWGTLTEERKGKVVELSNQIDRMRLAERIYWKQRSGAIWMIHGDKNTTFFHRSATNRYSFKQIGRLFDKHGQWHTSLSKVQEIAEEFYKGL
ncbi:hypothetical protein LIER_41463 [Lithospermum erythrorhizon]|uniref:Uncharacterized protein n=1 Tax=Lithospermum erythrorhizon TaxID=34254 RepID=A0AAV3RCP1_LITER